MDAKAYLKKIRFCFFSVILACIILGPAFAAKVYKSRISPNWSEDGSYMWYRNDLAKGAKEYVLVDLKKGTRESAFDQNKLSQALIENGLKGVQADRLPIDRLQFDLSENKAFFRAKGKHFAWNRKTPQLKESKPPEVDDLPEEEKKASKRKSLTARAENDRRMGMDGLRPRS